MDDRFPLWLRRALVKLHFLNIPNLGGILCGLAALGFLANWFMPIGIQRFLFDPELVLQGEWWRLVTFPFTGGLTNPIFLLFYVMYLYFISEALESTWGPGPFTVYVLLGYLGCLIVAFITGYTIDISYFLIQYLTLAFGTLYPDYELNLYGIIPVKAKWFAWLAVLLIMVQFAHVLTLGFVEALALPLAFLPYLVFFGSLLLNQIRNRIRTSKNRRRFHDDMWK
jgi:hypothetical protein